MFGFNGHEKAGDVIKHIDDNSYGAAVPLMHETIQVPSSNYDVQSNECLEV
jgi:hypothetical protein